MRRTRIKEMSEVARGRKVRSGCLAAMFVMEVQIEPESKKWK